jgi:hypothetical protein
MCWCSPNPLVGEALDHITTQRVMLEWWITDLFGTRITPMVDKGPNWSG